MDSFILMWKNYFNFSGRTRRKDYWTAWAISNIIGAFLYFIVLAMEEEVIGIIFLLFLLIAIPAGISMMVRRLHDIGKSGWWLLIAFVPFGGFVLLAFLLSEGVVGANEYGKDPKNENIADTRTDFYKKPMGGNNYTEGYKGKLNKENTKIYDGGHNGGSSMTIRKNPITEPDQTTYGSKKPNNQSNDTEFKGGIYKKK